MQTKYRILPIILVANLLFIKASFATGFRAEPVLTGLAFPVSMAFSKDGRLFFTERCTGNIRVIEGVTSSRPEIKPDAVYQFGPVSCYFERGLLGLALDPQFDKNGFLYVYYSHKGSGPNDLYRHRLMRITVKDNKDANPMAILDNLPIGSQRDGGRGNHNGGNIAFGPDGKLYLTIGDLAESEQSQDVKSFAGKILRLNSDGSAPKDNPFYEPSKPASPKSYIYAYGLRNSFDFTFNPVAGIMYATENGPESNDELNMINRGKNYGWDKDEVSGKRTMTYFEDPLLVYTPTIAPTGISFYKGTRYPAEYRGNLYFADWNNGHIHRVTFKDREGKKILQVDDNFYVHQEGIVDIIEGPDGYLYFSDPKGIYRIVYEKD